MRDEISHPLAETLESFAAEELAAGDSAAVESHVVSCERCRAAVDEWRSLFAALSDLPRYEPAAGFADRVMAGVTIRVPWPVRARAWARSSGQAIERVLPKTTRGWAVASAFLALPVLVIGGLLAWLLSRSYVTGHDLWIFATERFGTVAATAGTWAFQRTVESDVAVWLLRTFGTLLEARGAGGLGVIATMLGVAMAMSLWVLYTNLFRSPTRDANYVTYSF